MNLLCPLCLGDHTEQYFQKKGARDFYQCRICQLVFLDPQQRLNAQQEKAEYDLHNNQSDDKGYRQFLSRLQQPLMMSIKSGAKGLDFGCGPGPTLSLMLEEAGYAISLYDIFYHDKLIHHFFAPLV